MQTATSEAKAGSNPHAAGPGFPPLDGVSRPTVPTEQAAFYLDRKPQTLRTWACLETGPLRPIRVHGRLAWPVAEIRRLLEVA